MTAYQLAIVSAGVFFLNALLTGVWKYRQIAASDQARAHPYVDPDPGHPYRRKIPTRIRGVF